VVQVWFVAFVQVKPDAQCVMAVQAGQVSAVGDALSTR